MDIGKETIRHVKYIMRADTNSSPLSASIDQSCAIMKQVRVSCWKKKKKNILPYKSRLLVILLKLRYTSRVTSTRNSPRDLTLHYMFVCERKRERERRQQGRASERWRQYCPWSRPPKYMIYEKYNVTRGAQHLLLLVIFPRNLVRR